nr:MAG: coat protein [Leviviridae sp.]
MILMSLTINTKPFNLDTVSANGTLYVGPAHSFSSKDVLGLGRQPIKSSATFSGMSRGNAKLTRSHALTGAVTEKGDSFVAAEFGIALGTADADVEALVEDFAAYVSSQAFLDQAKKRAVNFG